MASLLQVSPHVSQALWSNTVRCYLIYTQETKAELQTFIQVHMLRHLLNTLILTFSSLNVFVSLFQTHSLKLQRFCEGLGHFCLNVSFPEEKAALYAAERRQEIERSSVCVLLLKSSVSR